MACMGLPCNPRKADYADHYRMGLTCCVYCLEDEFDLCPLSLETEVQTWVASFRGRMLAKEAVESDYTVCSIYAELLRRECYVACQARVESWFQSLQVSWETDHPLTIAEASRGLMQAQCREGSIQQCSSIQTNLFERV